MSIRPVVMARIFSPALGPNLDADPLVVLSVCLTALEAAPWCEFDVQDNTLGLASRGCYADSADLAEYLRRYLTARGRIARDSGRTGPGL